MSAEAFSNTTKAFLASHPNLNPIDEAALLEAYFTDGGRRPGTSVNLGSPTLFLYWTYNAGAIFALLDLCHARTWDACQTDGFDPIVSGSQIFQLTRSGVVKDYARFNPKYTPRGVDPVPAIVFVEDKTRTPAEILSAHWVHDLKSDAYRIDFLLHTGETITVNI